MISTRPLVLLIEDFDDAREIPVLMLTGHALGDARERALAAGARGFIAKPCLPDDLARQIHTVLEQELRPDR